MARLAIVETPKVRSVCVLNVKLEMEVGTEQTSAHDTRNHRVSCITVYRYLHDNKCLIHDTYTKILGLCITIENLVGLQ